MINKDVNSKISIIVPIYNVEKYVADCLESVINQSYKNIEIICIDDASDDTSLEIVKEYAEKDKRIKVICLKENSGLSTARNVGIRAATGKYLMFLDSDDMYKENCCEVMLTALVSTGSDIAICGIEIKYEGYCEQSKSDNQYFDNKISGTCKVNEETVSYVTNVAAWNKLYKTDVIKKNNIEFPDGILFESYSFWGKVVSVSQWMTIIPEKLYTYRRRMGGIMSKTFEKEVETLDYVRSAISYYEWLIRRGGINKFERWLFWKMFYFCMNAAISHASPEKHTKIINFAQKFLAETKFDIFEFSDNLYRNNLIKSGKYRSKKIIFKTLAMENIGCGFKIMVKDKVILSLKYHPSVQIMLFGKRFIWEKSTFGRKGLYLFGRYLFFPVWTNNDVFKIDTTRLLTRCVLAKNRMSSRSYIYRNFYGHKVHVDLSVNSNFNNLIKTDDANLINALKEMGEFTFVANPGNLGDGIIAASTYKFFDDHGIKYKDWDEKREIETMVYGGGGIWYKNNYKQIYKRILELMKNAKKVLILPSSISECDDLIKILDEKFIVFCREQNTFNYLLKHKTRARVYLDHDMALRATPKILVSDFVCTPPMKVVLQRSLQKLKRLSKIGYLLRTDEEREAEVWTDYDVSKSYGSNYICKDDVFFATACLFSIVNAFEIVVTDRLHVSIAAALLGKKVYMIDNKYGKLSGVYKQSLLPFSNVSLVDRVPLFKVENDSCTMKSMCSLAEALKC